MKTRIAFVLAAGLALAGCSFGKSDIPLERNPYEDEYEGARRLETALNDPRASDADIEAAFESHALTLMSHSENVKDKFNFAAIQKMTPGDPVRTRKIELSTLAGLSRDPENTSAVRRLETQLKRGKPEQVQAARRATWQMTAKAYRFY